MCKVMKKVILYGVANIPLRRRIEQFPDDEYEIIGCSDTYLTVDTVDQKPFFRPEQLSKVKFDYIVLGGNRHRQEIVCERH